ncbi:S-adenosyl-L-methionine-dependent methyltransferase [Lasiosphaeria hispida]|uniref:S-adenosyl-L-methionine-dependent methyltransferase n=1 Tax=Lasiosphaeria hispida TaxID=260671 RepID=A0AAJ0MDX1_9PEZI|nr:S-adenosyl-L-methionine-dependent methyltransferase [Lasiosphaeria hispida]
MRDAPVLVDEGIDTASIASSTASLTESVYAYRKLHGRPYKKTSTTEYWAPVDETQNEGLEIIHNVLLMALGDKLYEAPIGDSPGNVLDVGTGTGIWAIDFADQHPTAAVTGTDISPIQPTWVPPNCKFEIDDCLLEWTWPLAHFDYVHLRCLYGSIPDWESLYAKAFRHLKPGGWLENMEMDFRILSDHVSIPDDHIFNKWAELFYIAGEKIGRSFAVANDHFMRDLMIKVGFVDVTERGIKVPLHGWPKDTRQRQMGLLGQFGLDQSLDGFGTFMLTQIHGWDPAEAAVFIASMRKETRKVSYKPWYWSTVVYGRKPPDAA